MCAAGSHEITAVYSGDEAHAPSTSPVVVQVVIFSQESNEHSKLSPAAADTAVRKAADVARLERDIGSYQLVAGKIASAEGNRLRAALSGSNEVGSEGDPDGSGTARISTARGRLASRRSSPFAWSWRSWWPTPPARWPTSTRRP